MLSQPMLDFLPCGPDVHSSSLLRSGGVLAAMMTSLALPDRRVLSVDL